MGDKQTCSEKLRAMYHTAKPYLLMILMQFGSAGMYIITMSTFSRHGMSPYVFIVYRNAIAAITLAPFAFFLEKKVRPKMTFPIFWRIMLLGFLEIILDQGFAFLGMVYTSASYTSAITNAVPSITFLMAVIMRLERVKMRERRSQAKVLGTIITFSGALLMALYKGPVLNILGSSSWDTNHQNSRNDSAALRWIIGTLFLLISCVAFASFFIVQSMVLKMYPAEMSLSSLICFVGTLQSISIALAIERHSHAWAIGWDSRLFAPLYSGIVASGIMFYVQGLVAQTRGPVFVTAFNPLRMIIVVLMAVAILGEKLYLGSIIGSVIVALGLYGVIWGKSKDCFGPNSANVVKEEGQKQLPITMPSMASDPKAEQQLHMTLSCADEQAQDQAQQEKTISTNERTVKEERGMQGKVASYNNQKNYIFSNQYTPFSCN